MTVTASQGHIPYAPGMKHYVPIHLGYRLANFPYIEHLCMETVVGCWVSAHFGSRSPRFVTEPLADPRHQSQICSLKMIRRCLVLLALGASSQELAELDETCDVRLASSLIGKL